MDGAYRPSLKATLVNESCAARQCRLAASLLLLSNTCWPGKYESPVVWFSSYSVIKVWHLVKWLARTDVLQSQFPEASLVRLRFFRGTVGNGLLFQTLQWRIFFTLFFYGTVFRFLTLTNNTVNTVFCCFLNLIHAVRSDKYPVLILSCVPSWTLRSQMCCHGAELLLPSELLISVRSPPRLK